MRGGNGSVEIRQVAVKGEYKGDARLIAEIVLEENCSIGEHIHEGEEEIFYVIEGTAQYNSCKMSPAS